ncbi:MAG: hypothetical protein R3B49_08500 [Phycisphaerales bacterium]
MATLPRRHQGRRQRPAATPPPTACHHRRRGRLRRRRPKFGVADKLVSTGGAPSPLLLEGQLKPSTSSTRSDPRRPTPTRAATSPRRGPPRVDRVRAHHKLTSPNAAALARLLTDQTTERAAPKALAADLARPAERPLKAELELLAPTLDQPDRLAIVRGMVELTRARATLDYAAVERLKPLALLIKVPPPVLNGLLVELDDPRSPDPAQE